MFTLSLLFCVGQLSSSMVPNAVSPRQLSLFSSANPFGSLTPLVQQHYNADCSNMFTSLGQLQLSHAK